ncbi:MAG: GNAT family N-acetyltransferase, partial [Flavobacteriales bacterium]
SQVAVLEQQLGETKSVVKKAAIRKQISQLTNSDTEQASITQVQDSVESAPSEIATYASEGLGEDAEAGADRSIAKVNESTQQFAEENPEYYTSEVEALKDQLETTNSVPQRRAIQKQIDAMQDVQSAAQSNSVPQPTATLPTATLPTSAAQRRIAAKAVYRNPDDASQTWTGRGKQPQWVQAKIDSGTTIDSLRIENQGMPTAVTPAAVTPVKIEQSGLGYNNPKFEAEILTPARQAIAEGNSLPYKNGIQMVVMDNQDDGGTVIALDKDGQLVGSLDFVSVEEEDGTRHNPQVYVRPKHRREGVASEMYRLAEEQGAKIPAFDQEGQARTEEGQALRESMDRKKKGLPPLPKPEPYRLKPVRIYRTKGGKVGAEVKETRDAKGRLTYSYMGEWGAGSVDADSMMELEAEWQSSKRGYTVEEVGGDSESPPVSTPEPVQSNQTIVALRQKAIKDAAEMVGSGRSDEADSLIQAFNEYADQVGVEPISKPDITPSADQDSGLDTDFEHLPLASTVGVGSGKQRAIYLPKIKGKAAGWASTKDDYVLALDNGRYVDLPPMTRSEAIQLSKTESKNGESYNAHYDVVPRVYAAHMGYKPIQDTKDLTKKPDQPESNTPKRDTVPDQFADNKIFTADKVAAARERLRKKLNQLNSGIDPELLVDGMMIAGAYIESGTRKFSDYAQKMIGDMGDNIKPYLLSFWEGARNYPNLDTTGMTDPAESKQLFTELNQTVSDEMKLVVGEKAKPVGRREKKTGKPADRALRQDWGVVTGGMYPSINGWAESPDFPNAEMTDYGLKDGVKDAFLDDAKKYLQATATELEQMGYVAHASKKGKIHLDSVSVNAAGVAVSGDVTMTLRHMETGASLYVSIGESSFHGMTPSTKNGIGILFRASMSGDKTASTGGGNNMWSPVALTASELSKMLDQHVQRVATNKPALPQIEDGLSRISKPVNAALESVSAPVQTEPTATQDNTNEPTELGQPSPRTLEGVPADSVQGTEGERPTGSRATESSGTDLSGDGRTGESGLQRTRSMGGGAPDVPVSGGGIGAGSIRSDRSSGRSPQADVRQSGGDTLAVVPAPQQSDDFALTEQDKIGSGGAKTKFRGNIEAIRILKAVVSEGRKATREEQRKLAKFVGWGGLQQAFRRDDGSVANGWAKEVDELENLLTPDEYKAAVDSSIAAHYTSPEIVKGIWDAVKQLGFAGGRVLEPSMGSGNFFGMMPKDLRKSAQLHGVELDNITGHLAQQLYPEAKIKVMGFQDYAIPDGHFDLAIGNPPFGAIKITDASRPRISGLSMHNYFFAKSVDALAENGVLAMVVTNRLLDASNASDKARQYMAERTEFLGAIRLPNNAFAKNAGTEVTTDIVFLRKLTESERTNGRNSNGANGSHAWVNVRPYTDKNGKQVPLNEYFHKNPSMMLGEFGAYGSMYTPDDPALVAREGQNTPELMAQAIAKLPKAIMADRGQQKAEAQHEQNIADIPNVKVGSMFVQDGQVYVRQPDQLGERQAEPVEMPSAKALDRVTGMTEIRDALNQLRLSQLSDDTSPESIEADRAALNKAYDAFVKRNGYLNSDANKRLFRDDPSWPQLSSLEDGFDKGISAAVSKNTGEQVREPSAKKAAIFQKRTQFPHTRIESVSNAKDGMVESLNRLGQLDIGLIAQLYGKDEQAIVKELGDLIYQDPVYGWVTADEYLSGNVKKKLAQAKDAVASGEDLQRNVEALEKVQPADIEAVDIEVRAGSHWIPSKHVVQFIKDTLAVNSATAHYNNYAASWDVTTSTVPESSQTSFGTIRANAATILIAALNGKQITIYDQLPQNKTEVNAEATAAANEKVEQVKRAWADWIWTDDARRVELARIYNDTFNTTVQQRFDGAHLSLLGKVDNAVIELRPHQADAIWRITQTPTALLDHVVGAGKTFTMIGAIMELRRMGKSTKPMLVVPNHLVGQWAADFQKLYPSANILAANKKDFEKNNRKRLFARIATGDWDAVIVAHSSFGKVPLSPEEEAEFMKAEIKDMMDAEARIRSESGKDSRNAKDIAKRRMTLEEKLKKLMAEGRKDSDNLYWHELGVDSVFVDEAHEFKNLAFSSGMQRVAGLGNQKGSQKAFDLSMKIKSIKNRIAGSKIVFATGTPISNTMAEMYTMQRYLDLDAMQEQGLGHFDAWAKMFGQVVSDWELSPAGKYKMNSRFAKFVNMPELMQRYLSFADVINRDDINRQLAAIGQTLGTPKIKGDKPQNIVVERSDDQAGYIGEPIVDKDGNETYPEGTLVHRAENLPKKAEKGADNMLKIMSDARKAALDMRLIDPSLPDFEGSKTNEAVRRTVEIYKKWDADKGTQLIFCDLSTPKGAAAGEKARIEELIRLADQGDEEASEQLDKLSPDELDALNSDFSVYDDIKAKLIKSGIPEKEIAFIHDAKTELQKEELFGKVKSGRIRVLLGSTAKMGAGMNVQNRLVALHHLDAPWRPSDLEQREGRIIRQGNEFNTPPTADRPNPLYKPDFEVEILRYATKQTLDSRMWQTLESKARFIEQVRKGDVTSRVIEDVGGEAANAAEMKAASSGNPLILEEMSLRRELQNLESEKSRHNREQHRIKDTIRSLVRDQSSHDRYIAELTQDMSVRVPEKFEITIGKKTFKQGQEGARDQAGELLKEAAIKSAQLKQDFKVGSYGDFDLFVQHYQYNTDFAEFIAASPVTGGKYSVTFKTVDSPAGLITKIGNRLRSIPDMLKAAEDQKARDLAEIPKLESQLKDWSKADELEAKREQHKSIIDQLKPKQKPEKDKVEAADIDSVTGAEMAEYISAQEGLASRKDSQSVSGQTVEQVRDLLTERFGADVVAKLEANGKLVIVQSVADLPKNLTGVSENNDGVFIPSTGVTFLIGDNLTPRTVIPTLLHEMGGHAGFQEMMRPEQYAELMRQFDRMVKQGNPIALEAQKLAMRESDAGTQQLEMLPYLLTLAANPNV